ncbi:MAG: DNA-binding NtrC family response regulator [Verrucomicrobiales bacterium]|jgi:DNA-binding NtrC family response regulator
MPIVSGSVDQLENLTSTLERRAYDGSRTVAADSEYALRHLLEDVFVEIGESLQSYQIKNTRDVFLKWAPNPRRVLTEHLAHLASVEGWGEPSLGELLTVEWMVLAESAEIRLVVTKGCFTSAGQLPIARSARDGLGRFLSRNQGSLDFQQYLFFESSCSQILPMKKILVVDDERGTIEALKAIFYQRYEVLEATCVEEVFTVLEHNRIELLLLDIILSKDDGLEILRELRQRYPDTPVIMLSAVSSTSTIAEAIRLGAVEFITKPFNVKDIRLIADEAVRMANQRRKVEATRREGIETGFLHEMPGESLVYRNFLHKARQLALSDEHAVLVGERGTGKDTIARLMHTLSMRSELPFIKAQCVAGREDSFEREFFGQHSETQSTRDMALLGKLDLAGGGMMYVDDLHLLSPTVQGRLGKLLRDGTFMRERGAIQVKSGSRMLFSVTTMPDGAMPDLKNDDLIDLANQHVLHVPSLRERSEDVPLLAYALINRLRVRMQVAVRDIDARAMDVLRRYDWPGNVRELENAIEGILFIYPTIEVIKALHLPQEIQWNRKTSEASNTPQRDFGSLEERTDAFQRSLIIEALNEARGIKSRAAELLGTTPRILSYRIDQLKIDHHELDSHGRSRFTGSGEPSESEMTSS